MSGTVNREYIVQLLCNNDRAVIRALLALNKKQTLDEQQSESTRHHNNQGFRPCHARMGSSMVKFFERNGYLTQKQIAYWRHRTDCGKMRIEIYANQLLKIAREKGN